MVEKLLKFITFSVVGIDTCGNILYRNPRFESEFGDVENVFELININFHDVIFSAIKNRYPVTFFDRRHRKVVTGSREYYAVVFLPAEKGTFIVEFWKRNLENIKDELVSGDREVRNVIRKLEIELLATLNRLLITGADVFEFATETGKKLFEYGVVSRLSVVDDSGKVDFGNSGQNVTEVAINGGTSRNLMIKYRIGKESEISFRLLVDFWIKLIKLYSDIKQSNAGMKIAVSRRITLEDTEFVTKLTHRMEEAIEKSIDLVSRANRELFEKCKDSEIKDLFDDIQKRLIGLEDTLKIFSEVVSPPIPEKEIDLLNLLKNLLNSFRRKLPKGINVELMPDSWNPHLIQGESDRLNILFSLLLERALKNITESGNKTGTISVRLNSGEKEYLLTIRDTGKKMLEEEIDELLSVPERLDDAYQSLLLRSIIFQHGMRFTIHVTETGGNTFALIVPRKLRN
ncbi:ATP-binding protein [Kosmotoga pacifica]|uniref:Histidine kinase domain-containing protein n=1 Tax=Kosmotoga pacifica TaxID=1330330 RepID=A0A0G2Z6L7_9BACT|nr:ATP-binding protein [Kosmotoga pacifica]AKI97250.1 hypothetical protein IX53_04835 [Kosmotoga pacifica]